MLPAWQSFTLLSSSPHVHSMLSLPIAIPSADYGFYLKVFWRSELSAFLSCLDCCSFHITFIIRDGSTKRYPEEGSHHPSWSFGSNSQFPLISGGRVTSFASWFSHLGVPDDQVTVSFSKSLKTLLSPFNGSILSFKTRTSIPAEMGSKNSLTGY